MKASAFALALLCAAAWPAAAQSPGGAGCGVPQTPSCTVIVEAGSAIMGHVITDSGSTTVVTSLPATPAGTNVMGSVVTGLPGRVEVTPAVQNAQYVSGNDIGGLVAFTLPVTARGILQSVGIQYVGGATTTTTAYCFDALPNTSGSVFTDKGTFSIAAADESKRINKPGYPLTPAATTGDAVASASQNNIALPFNSTPTIWCTFAAGGTFTPATVTDLRVFITFVQNVQ